MDYYPLFLNLAGRRIVVIGGGKVGQEKIRGLLAGGADSLTVIAPKLLPALQELKDAGRFVWRQAEYRDGNLEGFDLCFVRAHSPVFHFLDKIVASDLFQRRAPLRLCVFGSRVAPVLPHSP